MSTGQRIALTATVVLLLVIGVAPLLAVITASVMIDGKPSLIHYQALRLFDHGTAADVAAQRCVEVLTCTQV